MESIERIAENYAVVFNVNLVRATLNEASEFKDLLSEVILDTDKDIIVNLSPCEHLDSTFLGVLVSSYKKLKSQNRSLVIIEPIDQSSIFLTLNSIGKIFPLYTSVKVALEDIENKRLIEKEINDLGEEKPHSTTHLDKHSKIDYVKDITQEEKKIEEVDADITLNTESIKTSEEVTTLETEKFVEDHGLNLIEHVHVDNESNRSDKLKSEDLVPEEKSDTIQKKVVEETEPKFDKNKSENEKSPFVESVKWEFGISS